MKKSKIAASVLAVSVAVSTLLTGCTQVPSDSDSSGGSSNNTSSGGNSSAGGDSSTGSSSTGESSGGESSTDNKPAVDPAESLAFASGTVLRMATGYNNSKTGLFFDPDVAKDGVTLADGKTYNSGDLKPTWVAVEEKLGMKFENKYQGKSASEEYDYWDPQLGEVDMVSGTASKLTENGVAGKLVNIAEYLDKMPNFSKYLDENPIVRLSITGDTADGSIYFSPYFDGVDDIERMPLMRVDWVQKLLDGEGEFKAEASGNTATPEYQPYMPTEGSVDVDVVEKDGKTVKTIKKTMTRATTSSS